MEEMISHIREMLEREDAERAARYPDLENIYEWTDKTIIRYALTELEKALEAEQARRHPEQVYDISDLTHGD